MDDIYSDHLALYVLNLQAWPEVILNTSQINRSLSLCKRLRTPILFPYSASSKDQPRWYSPHKRDCCPPPRTKGHISLAKNQTQKHARSFLRSQDNLLSSQHWRRAGKGSSFHAFPRRTKIHPLSETGHWATER